MIVINQCAKRGFATASLCHWLVERADPGPFGTQMPHLVPSLDRTPVLASASVSRRGSGSKLNAAAPASMAPAQFGTVGRDRSHTSAPSRRAREVALSTGYLQLWRRPTHLCVRQHSGLKRTLRIS
jgi:hypothetical protein